MVHFVGANRLGLRERFGEYKSGLAVAVACPAFSCSECTKHVIKPADLAAAHVSTTGAEA